MKNRNPISYSLWLMPELDDYEILKDKIKLLSKSNKSPNFHPHVTLLSSFNGEEKDLKMKTEIMSNTITTFKVVFDGIGFLDEFFSSLFIRIKSDKKLIKAHKIASEIFNWEQKEYLPHLSLIYGDFSIPQKKKIIMNIGAIPSGFLAKNIFLAFNDELSLKWEIIEKFPLKI